MNTQPRYSLVALAIVTLSVTASACGPIDFCGGPVPETVVYPLNQPTVPQVFAEDCTSACVTLQAVSYSEAVTETAANCSLAAGAPVTEYLEVDAGPGVICDGLSYPTSVAAGTSCTRACLDIYGDGGTVDTCTFAPLTVSVTNVVDGGPTVTCNGESYPVPVAELGQTNCQTICMQLFTDGGIDPGVDSLPGEPSSCFFVSGSAASTDGATFADGGPAVSCTWEVAQSCDWDL